MDRFIIQEASVVFRAVTLESSCWCVIILPNNATYKHKLVRVYFAITLNLNYAINSKLANAHERVFILSLNLNAIALTQLHKNA